MNALNDYRTLWKAAFVLRQRPQPMPLALVLAGLLFFGGVVLAIVRNDLLLGVRVSLGAPLIVLLMIWTLHLLPGFVLMNTPAHACLVPRMRRRMIEMTVAGWLAAGGVGLLMPTWQLAPAVALYVISLSMGRSGDRISGFFVIVAVMSGTLLKSLPPEVQGFFMSVPGFACASLAVALFGAWALRMALPAGGERHFNERKRRAETIERAESMGRKRSDTAPKRMTGLYGIALRQAIRSRQPRRLMLHVLGPSSTVLVMLPAWIVMILLGVGAHLLLQRLGLIDKGVSLPPLGWVFFATMTLVLQLVSFTQWRELVKGARNEQAVLRLAARSPSAKEWNRNLGSALAGQVALNAALGVATSVALGLLTGEGSDNMIWTTSVASSLVMPGIALVLLDYSREQQPWSLPRWLVAVAVGAFVVALHLALQSSMGVLAWVLLAVSSNAAGAFVASRRWKRMLAAPVAFPAGRFA